MQPSKAPEAASFRKSGRLVEVGARTSAMSVMEAQEVWALVRGLAGLVKE